ncbi:uncharacterized protein LOC103575634 [Microplitis demolitor]|uniref:uncharacterized protein LOC103575634 n=1 Tax=Microplitis demolitor TaxID=69319 RepID=UPI0004CD5AE6|nr:uncharacterized protein LOC103575634 [Microplitis demolitor]
MKLFIIICLIGIAIGFPYMEDTNQNWGLVVDDDTSEDDSNYESRPISLDPIAFRPSPVNKPPMTSPPSHVDPRPSGPLDMSLHPAVWNKMNKDAIYFRDSDD